MTPLTQQTTLGQLVSMVFAIALLLGTVAGLSAVAGDDEAALREPPEAGQAQTPAANAEQRTAAATLSADDRSFIDTALKGGIAEVKEVALAQKKAGDPRIRQAAAHLEKDHKALNAELERIGAQYGVALPSEPSPERKTLYQKLEKLSVADARRAIDFAVRRSCSSMTPRRCSRPGGERRWTARGTSSWLCNCSGC